MERVPSKEAYTEAEQIVLLIQTGTNEGRYNDDMAHEIAIALDRFRVAALNETLGILWEEGWLGQSRKRIRSLINAELPTVGN